MRPSRRTSASSTAGRKVGATPGRRARRLHPLGELAETALLGLAAWREVRRRRASRP